MNTSSESPWMSKRSGQARIGTERSAKVCAGLPLMVKPSQAAFAEIDESLREVAATLGARPWQVIMKIELPQARLGILAVQWGSRRFADAGGQYQRAYRDAVAGCLQPCPEVGDGLRERSVLGSDRSCSAGLLSASEVREPNRENGLIPLLHSRQAALHGRPAEPL